MNNEIFNVPEIMALFTINFSDIVKKYPNEKYDVPVFKIYFNQIISILSNETIVLKSFLSYYYLFTFLHVAYSNYLEYIKHPKANTPELYLIVRPLKTNYCIVKNMFKYASCPHVAKIIKTSNIFMAKYKGNNVVHEFIDSTNKLDKILELPNDNYKKILSMVMYRHVFCENNKFKNFHSFYVKKIIESSKINMFTNAQYLFDKFIGQIPHSKQILNIVPKPTFTDTGTGTNYNVWVKTENVIKFILGFNKTFKVKKIPDAHINANSTTFAIINDNQDGILKIVIHSTPDHPIDYAQLQSNYNLVYFSVEELKQLNFLKKTFSNLQINVSKQITNLTYLLEFIHSLSSSLKILSNSPVDYYECFHPVSYTNYYYDTYYYFFSFLKESNIEINVWKRYLLDVGKYLYIYSYYDYYFYYSTTLMETIFADIKRKNQIFEEFLSHLKSTLKLPSGLIGFPPFHIETMGLDEVIYYNFEIPSYFKLFDMINALVLVFGDSMSGNQVSSLVNIFTSINNLCSDESNSDTTDTTNTSNTSNDGDDTSVGSSTSGESELSNVINVRKTNNYLELNVQSNPEYLFNTECFTK